MPFRYEHLVRAVGVSYEEFQHIFVGKAFDLVYDYETEDSERFIRTFHRLIAEKTVREFFNDPTDQFEAYQTILSSAALSNPTEARIIEMLLIEHLGPNAKHSHLRYSQRKELFKAASRDVSRRAIIHHWGILEADNGHHQEAEHLLKEALKLPKESEAYGGESDQNIITSLGSLYSYRAQEAMKQGKKGEVEEWRQAADRQFTGARYGFFPNVHAYHAHAYMHCSLGRITEENTERLEHYNSALNLLDLGKANTNPESQQVLYELETSIWSELDHDERIDSTIEELINRFNSPRGYSIRARILYHQAEAAHASEKVRTEKLKKAYERISRCLEKFPRDLEAIRFRIRLFPLVFPENVSGYYSLLRDWKNIDPELTIPSPITKS